MHVSGVNALSREGIPLLDLVVVAGSIDEVCVLVEAPHFSIVMALDVSGHLLRFHVALDDGACSQADHHFAVVHIQGPGQDTKADGRLALEGVGVDDADSAISASSV